MNILKNKLINMAIITLIVGGLSFFIYNKQNNTEQLIMGGRYYLEELNKYDKEVDNSSNTNDLEKYFRPSKLPIINNRNYTIGDVYDKKPTEINISKEVLKTPEDTIINYFSVLREAANPLESKNTGCGTIGEANRPYPIAYNFLTDSYKKDTTYYEYLKSFENILRTNLIKLEQVPTDKEHLNNLKYFVEVETIQGSDSGVGYFAYYYGYVYLTEENNKYKIDYIDYYGENYLCAPYHGWAYDAEMSVDIRYGGWCNLIKERHPTEVDGYKKQVKFLGNDGNEYMILFYELTNGTDEEIAQYKKDENGKWININLDPKKCLDKKTS
ncbi:hypothetical protein [Romboutsia sp.]|uniref:hypothetical protein n=1 Tax=Romboutsia sp. TaxID=1965302 RepID=UPI003F3237ED